MTDVQHLELLDVLRGLSGMVVLSGYDHPLYQEALAGWISHRTKSRISTGRGTGLRTEVAWINPACAAALATTPMRQHSLALEASP